MRTLKDVTPASEIILQAVEEAQAHYEKESRRVIKETETSRLIEELFGRGVPYAMVFDQYYAMQAIGDNKLTVGDAELAGYRG